MFGPPYLHTKASEGRVAKYWRSTQVIALIKSEELSLLDEVTTLRGSEKLKWDKLNCNFLAFLSQDQGLHTPSRVDKIS